MQGGKNKRETWQLSRDDRRAWRHFLGYYRPYARKMSLYVIAASVQSALVIPVFYLVRFIFDVAIPASSTALLVYAGLGIVVVRAISGAIMLWARKYIVRVIKQAITRLRLDLVTRLYRLSRAFHSHADLSLLHTRLVQDTERLDNVSNTLFSAIVPSALSGLVITVALFVMNWSLTMLMILIAPAVFLGLRVTGRNVRREVHAFQRAFEEFSNGILFVLRQMDLTRLLAHEEGEIRRQSRHADRLRLTGESMAMSFAVHRQIQQHLTGLAGAAVLIAGGAQVAMGVTTLGALLAFYVAAGLLNGIVNTMLGGLAELSAGTESLAALRALAEAGPMDPYTGTRQIAFQGNIALTHVSFDYGAHTILRDIDLTFGPGARHAIVGANGAGKTTILNIIAGFERPKSGTIHADGFSYDDLDMSVLRRQMGVVAQNMTAFSGTVRDNIGYGRPDATQEEIAAAAKLALAHDFISALPDGYNTPVGESGHLLSGGECQRIAIARALMGRPRLLILDEPTNHLDAEAIRKLCGNLAMLEYRPAILLISHDPRVIDLVDKIHTLEQGVLVPAARSLPASDDIVTLATG
jgi:ATP-binding cassette, subfamily B, bacterial